MKKEPIIDLHVAIQGEGRDMGASVILIRYTGCNLRCEFKETICDTPYSSFDPEKGKFSIQDIESFIQLNSHIKYAMITGGNPTLHSKSLQNVLDLCKKNGLYTSIEDNGTLFRHYKNLDFAVISPKMSNSDPDIDSKFYGMHTTRRLRHDSIKLWLDHHDSILKFVVSDATSMGEITELTAYCHIDPSRVYLMPEGITASQIQSKRALVMKLAMMYGYRYSDRLHIQTYGNERNK